MQGSIKRLSNAELEIMMVVWEAGEPVTSTYILDRLKGRRPWALSTLMSVLARLADKGYLTCDRSTRTNLYSPVISEGEYKATEGKTMLEKLFGNSLRNLVTGLYSEKAVDETDLAELRRYLDELEGRDKP